MRQKARMTITLSKDVLTRIDSLIDGKDIRNRSHAIEHLVRKSLEPKITTAVILAGSPEQKSIPSLSMIGDKQLIVIMLEHLKAFNIHEIYILAGAYAEHIKCVVGDGSKYGVTVRYIEEPKPLGTAGSLTYVKKHIRHDFLVLHGDVLTTIDLTSFIEFHKQEKTLATIAAKPRNQEKKYGQVLLEGNKIIEFRAEHEDRGIGIVNTGVYILKPDVFSLLKTGEHATLETHVFPRLAKQNNLAAFLFQGIWFDISRAEDYELALTRWKRGH